MKRATKEGFCQIRLSSDGVGFQPLTPVGKAGYRFPCGRAYGFESAEYVLPKKFVNERGAVLQFEFEHELGSVVQCGDIIIQKFHNFVPQVCEPRCQNGGVCSNGVCKCSKLYTGESCEFRSKLSWLCDCLVCSFTRQFVVQDSLHLDNCLGGSWNLPVRHGERLPRETSESLQ